MGKIWKGIDVSAWQGEIDWKKAAAEGVEFAIIRCGWGTDKHENDDKYFERNYREAKAAGVKIGVYLYSYATNDEEAKSEALHVLRLLKGKNIDLPVYYDLEQKGCEAYFARNAELFGDIIESDGYWCGVYANSYHWGKYLSEVTRFTKWIANWGNNTQTSINDYGNVKTPAGADIHQFSSNGRVAGINGRVDLDVMYRDLIGDMGTTDPLDVYTDDELADKVLAGEFGNGEARIAALGDRYANVQAIVNERLAKSYVTVEGDTVADVAKKTGRNVEDLGKIKVEPGQKVKMV